MPRIVIVGAGPGGATLAYLLASRGIDVTLLERQHDFAREFRGEVLVPAGQDALRQMGLFEHLGGLPQNRVQSLALYRHARELARIDLAELGAGFDSALIVSQPAMLEMIVAQSSHFPTFRFHRGCGVRDLIMESGRVVGVLAGAEAHEFRADLVIAADGRASTVRRAGGMDFVRHLQTFDVVWCKVPVPTNFDFGSNVRVYLGGGHVALVFPAYGSQLQVGWLIRKGSMGELRRQGVDEWINELVQHVSDDLGTHLRSMRGQIAHPFLLDVVCDCLDTWTRPGLLLMGDAAHPMSPVGGQGINVALRDAIVIANHVVRALRAGGGPDALDAAAVNAAASRLPEVRAIQRVQHVVPRLLFNTAWWSKPIMLAVPLALRLGLVRAAIRQVARRMTRGFADVTLEV